MWLETLELKNVKCFEQKAFRFSPGFNVIIGDNGTGKTSIIESIGLIISKTGIPNSGEHIKNIARKVVTDSKNSIPTISDCTPIQILSNIRYHTPTRREYQRVEIDINMTDESHGYGMTLGSNHISLSEFIHRIINESHNYPILSKYSSIRRFNITKQPLSTTLISTRRIDGYNNWNDLIENSNIVNLWIKTLEISTLQRNKSNPVLESIRTSIRSAISDDQPGSIYYDIVIDELCIKKPNGEILPISLLSDGQFNMISMVMDIAIRCAILNPHLLEKAPQETSGIVLIDELDLHLHPKWQMRVVDDLKRTFPKIQFIVTTHSPLIIQSLKPDEGDRLIDLNDPDTVPDYEYSGRSPEDILEEGMGIEMPQRSHRWKEMYHAAEEYYELLDKAESADETERLVLREKLDVLMIPYDNNPAYAAYTSFLKQKRIVTGIDKV